LELENIDLETAAMELVGNSGESRSLSFEAIYLSKEGKIEEAKNKINKAKESMLKAHSIQTSLICKEAEGENFKIGLLMIHAQDHLMTSILAREFAEEIIFLHEKIDNFNRIVKALPRSLK